MHRWEKARQQIASRPNQDLWGKSAKKLLTKAGKAAASMSAELFDPTTYVYSVRTATALTVGGEMTGGRMYKVDLTSVTCTCCVPQLLHVPCSHMIAACRVRGVSQEAWRDSVESHAKVSTILDCSLTKSGANGRASRPGVTQ